LDLIDEENLHWEDLAICKNMDRSLFFEDYEEDPETAKNVDQACLACPVRKQCLQAGVDEKRWGVWGGVYLAFGVVDQDKNSHKTKQVWDKIRAGISDD
jgi:hypothetical protein